MAVVHGKKGELSYSGSVIATARSWTLTINNEPADISDFQSEWRKFIGGMNGWTGSADCSLDVADAGWAKIKADVLHATTPGFTASGIFTLDSGKTFVGDVIITSVVPTVGIDDAERFTLDFQGTGALTGPA